MIEPVPTSKEVITLGLVLKNLDNFDMSTFYGRLVLQKTVYLLQSFDVYIGYDFSWYMRGPYSTYLTTVGFRLQEVYHKIPNGRFEKGIQERFEKFLKFMENKKNNPDMLEILASIHFLKKIHPYMPKPDIVKKIKSKQKYFTKEQYKTAWIELENLGLI